MSGYWRVTLRGDAETLDILESENIGALGTVQRDVTHGHVLTSGAFSGLGEAVQVLSEAKRVVRQLLGVARLAGYGPVLEVGAVQHVDPISGRVGTTLFGEAGAYSTRFGNPVAINGAGAALSYIERLSSLAASDPTVEGLLELLEPVGAETWDGLHRVFEYLQHALQGDMPEPLKAKADRFTGSANSRAVAGPASRHSVQRGTPPTKTMTIADARIYVRRLTDHWIAAKLSG